jgi:O-antigen/teichoic acid export membrane protein
MQVLQSLLLVFFSISLERAIYRLYWDYKTEEEKKNFLGTITLSIVVISVSFVILLYLFDDYVVKMYSSINFYPFYSYTILTTFLSIFSLVPLIYFMIKKEPWKYLILSIIKFVSFSGFVLWFIVGERGGAEGMIKGGLLGGIFMFPLYAYILVKTVNFKIDFGMLKSALSYCLPLVPTLTVSWVLTLSDRIFIERYLTLDDVGIYSVAIRIAGLSMLIFTGFSQAYFPTFLELANSSDQIAAKNKLYKFNNISIIVIIFIGFIIAIFSKEVFILFIDKKYLAAYRYVPLMCLTLTFTYLGGLVGYFYVQSKKTKQDMVISLFMAAISIILNVIFIPLFGGIGAAWASFWAISLGTIFSYFYARKHCYFIAFNWKAIIPLSVILSCTVILFQYALDLNIILSLIIKMIIISSLMAYLLKTYYVQIKVILGKS